MIGALAKVWRDVHAPEGGYLVRRYVSFLGHSIAATVMMKLTWMGGMTEGYIATYFGFVTAHALGEKWIARRAAPAADPAKPE